MILDTEFLISLRAEEESALALAEELELGNVPTRIPTIVIEELYVGVGARGRHRTGTRESTRRWSRTSRSSNWTRASRAGRECWKAST